MPPSSPILMRTLAAAALAASLLLVGSCTPRNTGELEGMGIGQAVVLGLVEGLTEYIPVSSTGHLILAQRAMRIGTTQESKIAADAYVICIQAGAILAVLGLYRQDVYRMLRGLAGRDPGGLRLFMNIIVAFAPAAVLGLSAGNAIKEHLFGLGWVVSAWFLGGVAILLVSRHDRGSDPGEGIGLYSVPVRCALLIGLAQCIAVWPGTSRSLATIVGGVLVGLSVRSAVVFSFLLGAVTLTASTLHDAIAHGALMRDSYGWASILTGFVVAFLAAIVAVRWMVEYLKSHGLTLFGYYRIVLALVVAGLMAAGLLDRSPS